MELNKTMEIGFFILFLQYFQNISVLWNRYTKCVQYEECECSGYLKKRRGGSAFHKPLKIVVTCTVDNMVNNHCINNVRLMWIC